MLKPLLLLYATSYGNQNMNGLNNTVSQLSLLTCVRGMGTLLLNYFATTLALQPLSKSFDLSAFIS